MTGLPAAETLRTARLRIEAGAVSDVQRFATWIDDALKPDWSIGDLEAALDRGQGLVILDGLEAIGLVVVSTGAPLLGAASITFLAIEPRRRFRGLAGEAAIAVERHLRRRGFGHVYAPVPESRGLAVYFWLRLGFRPVTRADAPWPLVGIGEATRSGGWMLRSED